MRFYGMGLKDAMGLPVRTFWGLSAQVARITAEEHLALTRPLSCVNGGEHVRDVVAGLERTVGRPAVFERRRAEAGALDKIKRALRGAF